MTQEETVMNIVKHLNRLIATGFDVDVLTFNVVSYLAFETTHAHGDTKAADLLSTAGAKGMALAHTLSNVLKESE